MESQTPIFDAWNRFVDWFQRHLSTMLLITLMAVFAVSVFALSTVYHAPPSQGTVQQAILHTAIIACTIFLLWQVYRSKVTHAQWLARTQYEHELLYKDRTRLLSLFGEALILSQGESSAFVTAANRYEKSRPPSPTEFRTFFTESERDALRPNGDQSDAADLVVPPAPAASRHKGAAVKAD